VIKSETNELMDDLAMAIHAHLLEVSTPYQGNHYVLITVTEIVKKFQRNHRTIQRRIGVLKDEGLLVPVIRKNTIALYHVKEQEDQP